MASLPKASIAKVVLVTILATVGFFLATEGGYYTGQWDSTLLDIGLLNRPVIPASDRIVIITYDPEALDSHGWPMPYSVHAEVIERLTAMGARIIAPAYFFVDDARAANEPAVRRFPDAIDSRDHLEAAMRGPQKIVKAEAPPSRPDRPAGDAPPSDEADISPGRAVTLPGHDETGATHNPSEALVLPFFIQQNLPLGYPEVPGFLWDRALDDHFPKTESAGAGMGVFDLDRTFLQASAERFTGQARAVGFFPLGSSPSGFPTEPLLARQGSLVYPNFALALAAAFTGAPLTVAFEEGRPPRITLDEREVPLAANGELLVNYLGPPAYTTYTVTDLLAGQVRPEDIDGRLVIYADQWSPEIPPVLDNPFAHNDSAINRLANLVDQLSNRHYLHRDRGVMGTEILVYLLFTVLVAVASQVRSTAAGLSLTILSLAGFLLVHEALLIWPQYVTRPIPFLIGLALEALILQSWRSRHESRLRDRSEEALRQLAVELEDRVRERTADLNLRQQQLLGIVRFSETAIYLKNSQLEYLLANEPFAKLLDRPSATLAGLTNAGLLPPATEAFIESKEKELMETGAALEFITTLQADNPTRYHFFAFPVFAEGRLNGLGAIVLDLRARDQAEAMLRRAAEGAERASKAKSDFLANMSHEIRTPLNGIIGLADLLSRGALTTDQRGMIEAVKSSGESLLIILNDILDFSKIESGRLTLESTPFDLPKLIYDGLRSFGSVAYKKGLELILHVSADLPQVMVGDPVRLRQVLLNLVGNALKFTEKGEVVLKVAPLDLQADRVLVTFSVSDTGIGVPEDKKNTIFQAFEQADSGTTRKYGGTGLGLPISARLVELMGGHLTLESTPGRGSVFYFALELPYMDDSIDGDDVGPLTDRRVLVIDDNRINRQILTEYLHHWGLAVSEASGVTEGLETMRAAVRGRAPFNLVVLDFQMPERTGLELAREALADRELAGTPIIMLTSGYAGSNVSRDYPNIQAVLDKPVRPGDLLTTMLTIWSLGKQAADDEERKNRAQRELPWQKAPLETLLVEDMEINQLVASRMLGTLGCRVTLAQNGQEALEYVRRQVFDCIFMDINMPIMGGLESTRLIRRLEALENQTPVVIVAMTANAFKGDRDDCLEAGMDDYLSKPIVIRDLETMLLKWFEDGRRRRTSGLPSPAAPPTSEILNFSGSPLPSPAPGGRPAEDDPESGLHLDWAQIRNSFGDDEAFIREGMSIYLDSSRKHLSNINEALKMGDQPTLLKSTHALKGITGYYNHQALYQHIYNLEQSVRYRDITQTADELRTLVETIEEALTRMWDEMTSYCGLSTPTAAGGDEG